MSEVLFSLRHRERIVSTVFLSSPIQKEEVERLLISVVSFLFSLLDIEGTQALTSESDREKESEMNR